MFMNFSHGHSRYLCCCMMCRLLTCCCANLAAAANMFHVRRSRRRCTSPAPLAQTTVQGVRFPRKKEEHFCSSFVGAASGCNFKNLLSCRRMSSAFQRACCNKCWEHCTLCRNASSTQLSSDFRCNVIGSGC